MEATIYTVPRPIKAKTPEELSAKMLAQNLASGMFHTYQITHDGKQWVAWMLKESKDLLRERAQSVLA